MLYWFFSKDVIVSELKEALLSQYIVLVVYQLEYRGPYIYYCSRRYFENFENLSMQVRKIFLSVDKTSKCNISPTCEGIGVLPKSCLLGRRSYLALLQTLQHATTSLASFDMFGKY